MIKYRSLVAVFLTVIIVKWAQEDVKTLYNLLNNNNY
jgi:hypothetical protein